MQNSLIEVVLIGVIGKVVGNLRGFINNGGCWLVVFVGFGVQDGIYR